MSMIAKMNEALKAWMKSEDREMFGMSGPVELGDAKMFEFAFAAGWDAAKAEIPAPEYRGSSPRPHSEEHKQRIREGVIAAIEAKRQAEANKSPG